jgi:hypothetical protein
MIPFSLATALPLAVAVLLPAASPALALPHAVHLIDGQDDPSSTPRTGRFADAQNDPSSTPRTGRRDQRNAQSHACGEPDTVCASAATGRAGRVNNPPPRE